MASSNKTHQKVVKQWPKLYQKLGFTWFANFLFHSVFLIYKNNVSCGSILPLLAWYNLAFSFVFHLLLMILITVTIHQNKEKYFIVPRVKLNHNIIIAELLRERSIDSYLREIGIPIELRNFGFGKRTPTGRRNSEGGGGEFQGYPNGEVNVIYTTLTSAYIFDIGLWSIDRCQIKVPPEQYHMTILLAQV